MASEWKEVLSEAAEEAGIEYEPLEQTSTQIPEPEVKQDELGNLSIIWDDPASNMQLQCQVNKLSMQKDGMYSYFSVRVKTQAQWRWILEPGRINWYSMSSKTNLRRELDSRDNKWDWKQRLAQVVIICAQSIRNINKPVDLSKVQVSMKQRWLANPLLEADEHTVLFAAAGTGKSVLALGICIQISTGKKVIPGISLPDETTNVLYLDWETSQANHARRLRSICSGISLDLADLSDKVHYWRMEYPLLDSLEDIRSFVITNKIGLIIVDSAGVAADGDINSTEVGTAYIKAVRALGSVAVLTITHMSHDQIERGKGKTLRPIGSVYFQNGPRSSWGLVGDQDERAETLKHLGLVHVKSNNDALKSPIGFVADFSDKDIIRWKAESVHANQNVAQHATTNSRITNLLTTGGRFTLRAIYDELDDLKQDTVSRTVRRMVKAKDIAKEGEEYFALARTVPDAPRTKQQVFNMAGQPVPTESNSNTDTTVPLKGGTGVRVSKGKEDSPDSPPDSAGQKNSVRVEGDEEITTIKWD